VFETSLGRRLETDYLVTGRSATEPLEGGFAAMDRVGGGEKQLEDCTVAKSVISRSLSLCLSLSDLWIR